MIREVHTSITIQCIGGVLTGAEVNLIQEIAKVAQL